MARSKVEIICDILQVAKENSSAKKTRIIRLANLDWNMANKYLESLIDEGFLEKSREEEEKGGEDYDITEKGERLLEALKRLKNSVSIFRKE